jgi:xylulose-5-phosphate/fructose-6-phosphate phosphoketolase
VYLPPDANCLLSIARHCLLSTDHVNLVVADKQPHLQYLTLEEAERHCALGASEWAWASNDAGGEVDVVLACAGDVPTQEALAAAEILRDRAPTLRVRFVNVVDLMALLPRQDHPHGLDDEAFRALFGNRTEVVMAFHGYPRAVHQLLHGRPAPQRFHVRGFEQQGTTTTPFDMVVLNRMSRFHLVLAVLERVGDRIAHREVLAASCEEQLRRHHDHVLEHFEDLPRIRDWTWNALDREKD